MYRFYILFLFILLIFSAHAQNIDNSSFVPEGISKLIVMKPSGEFVDGLPEMLIISDTSELYKRVYNISENSFIKDFIELYFLAQNYLKNNNELENIEPAYLALTNNDGGFPRVGFVIKEGNDHLFKTKVPYIDIVEDRINAPLDKLMSMTQLYPHEMAHVIYGLLSKKDTAKNNYRSLDMHYFSTRTDYPTAFNEGFAEHVENVSRSYEKNDSIKKGIFQDIEYRNKTLQNSLSGFEKDLRYFYRIGFYKMTMINWYQKFENLKRYDHAINGNIKYKSASLDISNIEDRLTFRNSGIRQNNGELLNYVQMLSTEGLISRFFTFLSQSKLKDIYLEPSFYKAFLNDTSINLNSPDKIFSPLQNQFIKYFFVFHNYVCINYSEKAQFIDFVDGYINTFPTEEDELKNIFKEVTELEYSSDLPPALWLIVKDYKHRMLLIDPYGAITTPAYTFDLNASEIEDLLTIKNINIEDAKKIIEYRKTNGFFRSLEQLNEIDGLSSESINSILSSKFDQEYFDNLPSQKLSFTSILYAPLKSLLIKDIVYFALIFSIIYFVFLYKEKPPLKRVLLLILKYFSIFTSLILLALALVVFTDQAWSLFLVFIAFLILINLIIFRKNKKRILRSAFSYGLMCLIIIFSLI